MNRFVDENIFGSVDQSKIRFKRPQAKTASPKKTTPKPAKRFDISTPKNLKKVSSVRTSNFESAVVVGNIVEHSKFGKGEVINLDGSGANTKAEIKFETVGVKKILLQFAKLKILA